MLPPSHRGILIMEGGFYYFQLLKAPHIRRETVFMERIETGLHTALPRATPESAGVDSRGIAAFLQDVGDRGIELHSFMLLRKGNVLAEGWWAPYRANYPHMLFSLSKRFTSTAVGMAQAEGLLSLDDKVVDWFPNDLPDNIPTNLADMRIRHLLMMGTGHTEDTTGKLGEDENGDWARAFLAQPVDRPPGSHFVYNSGATYMLAAILRHATGGSLLEYLKPRLFAPLGIAAATWEVCPRGIATGGWGLNLRTEDIAKFGQLYLQDGVWEGERLLPEGWVREAGGNHISNGDDPSNDWNQGYGYQFWQCRHGAFRGDGAFGQFCIVMPEQEAVFAATAGTGDMGGVMNAVWDHLLPAIKVSALAPAGDANAELAARLDGLRLDAPDILRTSALEIAIDGRDYIVDENEMGISGIRLDFTEEGAAFVIENAFGRETLELGRGVWRSGTAILGGDPRIPANNVPKRVEGSLTWTDENELQLTLRSVETPFTFTALVRMDGDELLLEMKPNVSFGGKESTPVRARKAAVAG